MSETPKEKLWGGLGTFVVAGAFTAWQVWRWHRVQAWVIFFIAGFIPVPLVAITGIAAIAGLVYFIKGVFDR